MSVDLLAETDLHNFAPGPEFLSPNLEPRKMISEQEARKQFIERLNAGVIDADFVEYFRIALPKGGDKYNVNCEEQQLFEAYMQGIANRVLGSEFARNQVLNGGEVPKFRFFLQDSHGKNAAIYDSSNPPIVLITNTLFTELTKDGKEDLLAGVMAHELTHYAVKKQTDRTGNSKVEEGFADALPTFLLYHAGYEHNALEGVMKVLGGDSEDFGRLFSYIDDHPSMPLRQRVVSDSEGFLSQYLRRVQPDFQKITPAAATLVPQGVRETVEIFEHKDVIETAFREAKISEYDYNREYYEDKSKPEYEQREHVRKKVDFIIRHYEEWLDSNGQFGEVTQYKRARQLNEILNMSFGGHSEAKYEYEDVLPLFEKILQSPYPVSAVSVVHRFNREIGDSMHRESWENTLLTPPKKGLIREVAVAFSGVLQIVDGESVNFNNAQKACAKLLTTINAINPQHRDVFASFYYGRITNIPTQRDIKRLYAQNRKAVQNGEQSEAISITPPWDRLTQYALQEYQTKGTTQIADTLLLIGVEDPRLVIIPAHRMITDYGKPVKYFQLGFPEIMLDSQGKIIGSYDALKEYWSSYDVRGSSSPQNKDEAIKYLHKSRYIMRAYGLDLGKQLNLILPSIQTSLSLVKEPEDLQRIINQFPMHFAFQLGLAGGKLGENGIPVGSEASLLLVNRLEELMRADPNKWSPVVKDLFAKKFGDERKDEHGIEGHFSLHNSLKLLRHHFIDYPFSGKHDYFTYWIPGDREHRVVKIYLPEEIGMSPKHPYVKFVLNHTEGLVDRSQAFFSIGETLSVLDKVSVIRPRNLKGEELPEAKILLVKTYCDLFGWEGLSSSDNELADRLNYLRHLKPSVMPRHDLWREIKEDEWSSLFLIYQGRNEAYTYLRNHIGSRLKADAFEESLLVADAKIEGVANGSLEQQNGVWVNEIGELLEKQFLINAKIDLTSETMDALELANSYALFEKNGYFHKHPEIRWGDGTKTGYDHLVIRELARIRQEEHNPHIVELFAEKILFGCSVQSPELRGQLIEAWGEAQLALIGIDQNRAFAPYDETSTYYSSVIEITKRVLDKSPKGGYLHRSMLETLANKLETQSELTSEIFSRSQKHTRTSAISKEDQKNGPLSEFGLDFLVSEERTRLATIELLTSPLTEVQLEKYVDILADRQQIEERNASYDRTPEIDKWMSAFNKKPVDTIFAAATRKYDLKNPDVRREVRGRLRIAYENFWDSPLEARAYYMNLLAFPETRGLRQATRKDYDELVNYILDKVLPYQEKTPEKEQFNRYTEFGRDILSAYLQDATQPEQRLLLSALMVSARELGNSAQKTEESIGEALAHVLLNIGPAGVKLAQAVHSNLSTPETIRKGMEGVKGMANVPSRDEVFSRMEKVIQPVQTDDERKLTLDNISHVGRIIGSGSYQYTVEANLSIPINNQSQVAITILKPHVLTFANNEFVHFEKTIDRYIELRASKGEVIKPTSLHQVLKQASNMAQIETDYNTGEKQANLIQQSYNGLIVKVGEKKIIFDTVEWLDHGSRKTSNGSGQEDIQSYKVANIAPGVAYNTFTKTGGNEEDITDISTALQCAEDLIVLAGQHFDHDRHGDNFNVLVITEAIAYKGNRLNPGDVLITGYDFGAVNIDPPTKEERQILGKVIGRSISDVIEGRPFGTAIVNRLSDEISKETNDQTGGTFLSATLRGLLARGDFLKHLSSNDIRSALLSVIATGAVDSEILSSAISEITSNTKLSAGNLISAIQSLQNFEGKTRKVEIVGIPRVFPKSGGILNSLISLSFRKRH